MVTRRVIVCLDVRDGRVVKGVEFTGLRDMGDPTELAERYENEGADEIVLLDVTGRGNDLDLVRRAAERVFVPLTVGGGVRSRGDVSALLRAGADKVSINSAGVAQPELISMCARKFGSQCVVASIDVRGGRVWVNGGRVETSLTAIEWARRCAELGAGEILLTSIERDGTRTGYDVELTRTVADVVSVPVVASGGAGNAEHVVQALHVADAALVAGIVHERAVSVAEIKRTLCANGVPTRMTYAA